MSLLFADCAMPRGFMDASAEQDACIEKCRCLQPGAFRMRFWVGDEDEGEVAARVRVIVRVSVGIAVKAGAGAGAGVYPHPFAQHTWLKCSQATAGSMASTSATLMGSK